MSLVYVFGGGAIGFKCRFPGPSPENLIQKVWKGTPGLWASVILLIDLEMEMKTGSKGGVGSRREEQGLLQSSLLAGPSSGSTLLRCSLSLPFPPRVEPPPSPPHLLPRHPFGFLHLTWSCAFHLYPPSSPEKTFSPFPCCIPRAEHVIGAQQVSVE